MFHLESLPGCRGGLLVPPELVEAAELVVLPRRGAAVVDDGVHEGLQRVQRGGGERGEELVGLHVVRLVLHRLQGNQVLQGYVVVRVGVWANKYSVML